MVRKYILLFLFYKNEEVRTFNNYNLLSVYVVTYLFISLIRFNIFKVNNQYSEMKTKTPKPTKQKSHAIYVKKGIKVALR
jgi:hypothetical protein